MGNIMNLVKLRNKPSRNGFDLSFKRNFTAKCGELLPIMCKEVIPGDKVQIDLSAFTRTQPVNTAAFARIREYYDFFFVPFNQLWNRANTVLSQMDYNQLKASALVNPAGGNVFSGEMPYLTTNQIADYIHSMKSKGTGTTDNIYLNYFGYHRATASCKLLEYLNYGNYIASLADENPTYRYNLDVNVFGLLAYQKIYSDFFRDEQWEKPNPSTFNVDYMSGADSMQVQIPTYSTTNGFYSDYNFFDLRYCNWPKDLYHGLLPQAQYGDTTVIPFFGTGGSTDLPVDANATGAYPNFKLNNTGSVKRMVSSGTDVTLSPPSSGDLSQPLTWASPNLKATLTSTQLANLSSELTILALRQYEFLQKWKEIVQSAKQDYKSQTEAIWGVHVDSHLSDKCTYLGGINSSLDINEVVNTNITSDNAADIAGKGVGVSNGKITFDSDGQFGYIMCIYHAMPIVDYTVDYIDPQYLRVNAEDFANPVFDRVGMQAVNSASILQGVIGSLPTAPANLGYAPRYVDYKTSIDTSVGAFKDSLQAWVVSYNAEDILASLVTSMAGPGDTGIPAPGDVDNVLMSYSYFKVNPNLLDPIFAVSVGDGVDTDQLLCSSFFDIKAVRNLDTNGLPY